MKRKSKRQYQRERGLRRKKKQQRKAEKTERKRARRAARTESSGAESKPATNRQIYITEVDMNLLEELVEDADGFDYRDKTHLETLRKELARAKVVPQKDIPPSVVTMNSRVHLRILDSGEEMVCSLVSPDDADIGQNKMSVLAPVGTALLGYRVGDIVEWEVPAGLIKLRIEEVLYQPEAAGDYHL
jgi:regulator of nucleoside diphosphate kinase